LEEVKFLDFAMRFLPEMVESRREFVRAAVRYALLGLLTAGAYLTARRGSLGGQTCVNRGICSGCGQFVRCGLPQALSARQAKGGQT
jgi:hypothetical protein